MTLCDRRSGGGGRSGGGIGRGGGDRSGGGGVGRALLHGSYSWPSMIIRLLPDCDFPILADLIFPKCHRRFAWLSIPWRGLETSRHGATVQPVH